MFVKSTLSPSAKTKMKQRKIFPFPFRKLFYAGKQKICSEAAKRQTIEVQRPSNTESSFFRSLSFFEKVLIFFLFLQNSRFKVVYEKQSINHKCHITNHTQQYRYLLTFYERLFSFKIRFIFFIISYPSPNGHGY